MTYSAGNLIVDDDYNIFGTGNAAGTGDQSVANINSIWGTGSDEFGYGQTTGITAVTAGSAVQASEWATLLARNTSLASPTTVSYTHLTLPTTPYV